MNRDVAPLEQPRTAGRRWSTPRTRRRSSAPTAATPGATSRRTCCRRPCRAPSSSTPTRPAATTPVTSQKAKDGAAAVRPAERLLDHDGLPRRTGPKEVATARGEAAGAGQGRHQADAQGLPLGRLLHARTPASPTTRRPTTSASCTNGWGADWPDGFGFLSQIADSRTIRPGGGNYNLSRQGPRRSTRCIDKATSATRPRARASRRGPTSTRRSWTARTSCPTVWAKGLYYRPPTMTNVYFNPAFGMYDYVSLGVKK